MKTEKSIIEDAKALLETLKNSEEGIVRQTYELHSSLQDLEFTEKHLIRAIESLQSNLERNLERLKDSVDGINTCGIVQSSGTTIDMLVAKRAAQIEHIRSVTMILELSQ